MTAASERRELAAALATLFVVGGSFGIAVFLFSMPSEALTSFVRENRMDPALRVVLLAAALGGSIAGILAGLLLQLSRKEGLRKIAALSAPLALSGVLPVLLLADLWRERPLQFLIGSAVLVLIAEQLLARAFTEIASREWRDVGDRVSLGLVAAAALAYAVFAGTHGILRHWRFESNGFDLGIQDNLMWTAMHGQPFRSTVVFPDGSSFLAHHAEFASLLFVPIYALQPGAEMLLVWQALFFAAAAIPLYGFASTLLPRWIAALLALAYLLYAPMHGPNFYDFHWLSLAVPLSFAFFWSLAARRTRIAWALVAMLLLVREDVAIGLAAVGFFLVLVGERARFGAVLSVIALGWFLTIKFVVMPLAGRAPFEVFHAALVADGRSGYAGVLETLALNPVFALGTLLEQRKLEYLLHLVAPLAFVPFRRPALLVLALPGFFVTLLTSGYEPTVSIAFQYTTHWIPYLFAACVLHFHRFEAGARRAAAVVAVVFGVILHSHQFGAVLQQQTFVGGFEPVRFSFEAADREIWQRFTAVAARIPPDASVAATEHEIPHLTTRRAAYTLAIANGGADYLLVNRDHLSIGSSQQMLDAALSTGLYTPLVDDPPFSLFARRKPE